MKLISTVLAQEGGGGGSAPAQGQGGGSFGMVLPLIVVFAIFYLLIFRPQKKQQKLRKQMLAELKRGDEIITNGGIYGKITDLHDAFVMVQVANNVTIKFDRSQVNTVQRPPEMKMK